MNTYLSYIHKKTKNIVKCGEYIVNFEKIIVKCVEIFLKERGSLNCFFFIGCMFGDKCM